MSVVVPSSPDEEYGTPVDIQKAWRILAGGSPDAARSLLHVAKYGRSEIAKVTAASRLLSIVGLGEKQEINGTIRVIPPEYVDDGEDHDVPVSTKIRQRLAEQRAAYEQRAREMEPELEVIDAEIVD